MSKILKKITKKYKWLRFLNYKTTKLSILGVSLVGLCLSSGASFAKYRDENYGGGNAGVVKFGEVTLSYILDGTSMIIELPKKIESSEVDNYTGWHAFMATFKMTVSNVFIKQKISLSLELATIEGSSNTALQNTSFVMGDPISTDELNTFTKKDGKVVPESIENLRTSKLSSWEHLDLNISTIEAGKVYYGVWGTDENDLVGENDNANDAELDFLNVTTNQYENNGYKWKTKNVANNKLIFDDYIIEPTNNSNHYFYFKLLYFSYLTASTAEIKTESARITYDVRAVQL